MAYFLVITLDGYFTGAVAIMQLIEVLITGINLQDGYTTESVKMQ